MLSKEEFLRLQKLAAISLDDNETDKLWKQLGGIVDFLGKLKDVSSDIKEKNISNHNLKPISGIDNYQDYKSLFDNSKHDKIDNSIVVGFAV